MANQVPVLGVVGAGFVGGAMIRAFSGYLDIVVYDKNKSIGSLEEVAERADVIFVAVPTPMRKNGACDTRIVEKVIRDIEAELASKGLTKEVVIRSTVPPNFLRDLTEELIFTKLGFMPEFLTERTADLDFIMATRFIIGSMTGNRGDLPITEQVFDIRFPGTPVVNLSLEEASMVKYAANVFFTVKLSFFNELAQACNQLGELSGYCDFDNVLEELLQDGRIGRSHFLVPGPDGNYGWGGHCFPKDNRAFAHFLKLELGIDPIMTDAAWDKNTDVRPHNDWEDQVGRAVSND